MEHYNKKAEENLLEMKKREEATNRQLLRMTNVIGAISAAILVIGVISLIREGRLENMVGWNRQPPTAEFVVALFAALGGLFYAGEVERKAGYYKCAHCGHEQTVGTGTFFNSLHIGRTHYMKCPECGKKSWQKKVLTKDD